MKDASIQTEHAASAAAERATEVAKRMSPGDML
jgi:hypothetical protein